MAYAPAYDDEFNMDEFYRRAFDPYGYADAQPGADGEPFAPATGPVATAPTSTDGAPGAAQFYDGLWNPQPAVGGKLGYLPDSLYQPWGRSFQGSGAPSLPGLRPYTPPQLPTIKPFEKPAPFTFRSFAAPSAQEAQSEPGYELRRTEGERGLTNSAAAKGLLRSGGTIKDFSNYNQAFASNEYRNVYDRKRGEYEGEYRNAADQYDREFNNLMSAWEADRSTQLGLYDRSFSASMPQQERDLAEYGAGVRGAELGFGREWDSYQQEYRQWLDQQEAERQRAQWELRFGLDAAQAE